MSKAPPDNYDFITDPEMRELLFGEGGPLDTSPPVLPMLKRWTGSPRFHLDRNDHGYDPFGPEAGAGFRAKGPKP